MMRRLFSKRFVSLSNVTPKLCACPECDALQHTIDLVPGRNAHCVRCGAVVARTSARTPRDMLPMVLGGLVLFFIANVFPIVSFKLMGAHRETNVMGAVMVLMGEGLNGLAGLVFMTALFMPLFDLSILLYLIWPRSQNTDLPGYAPLLRLLQSLRPWGMMEVFMLGLVIALTKLSHTAEIIPGPAIWAYMALMFVLASILSYNPANLWNWFPRHPAS